MIRILELFWSDVKWAVVSRRHAISTMTKTDSSTMDIVCRRGCQSRLHFSAYANDPSKDIRDRMHIMSTNCPYFLEFRKRCGQTTRPLPVARVVR